MILSQQACLEDYSSSSSSLEGNAILQVGRWLP
jgi:hypothetical protein